MRRSKSKTPSADTKSKSTLSGPGLRTDWIPPHPALGAQVKLKEKPF